MSHARKWAGRVSSLTKMQWIAVLVFLLAAAAAILGSAFNEPMFVVLGLILGLAVLLAVEIFGFRQLTRRVQSRLDRVTSWNTAPIAVPETRGKDLEADDVLIQWAHELRSKPGRLNWFIRLARETRSRGARDVLALSATRGKHNYRSLVKLTEQVLLRPDSLEEMAELRRTLWWPGFVALARVLYSQRLNEWDLRNCLTLYELADRIYGVEDYFDGVDRSLYSDLLTWHAQYSRADDILDYEDPVEWRGYSQRFLQLNAVNPNVTGSVHKQGEWLARLNERFTEVGLAPLSFPDGERPSFNNIQTNVRPLDEEGLPLVSVIMPIYEPDSATDVAIASLLAQSWPNLEILIVDDASPAFEEDGTPTGYRQQLQSWAARDPRIRVTFYEKNRGAYAVRNDAFEAARGEFVTVADKDDWHHPQKIEWQARDLLTRKNSKANIVNWVRVDEDLKFLVRWGPDRVVHPSFASIMYRREEVMNTLGFWDAVRKSADGEYRTRFEITYGEKLVARENVPLAFSLLGDGNLTSNDFGLGYRHPDREIYQDAYGDWHNRIQTGDSPFMPKSPQARKFVGPPSFLPDRDKSKVPHYDVVFLSEFGLQGGNSLTLMQEIHAALSAGLRVGIIPLQNGLIPSASKRRIVPELEQLFLKGSVDRLTLDREATVDKLLIHWPTVMQLLPAKASAIRAEVTVVIANQLPGIMSETRQSYDVGDVSQNCLEIFGTNPLWASQSSAIRAVLETILPSSHVLLDPWVGVAQESAEHRSPQDFSASPVLGRPLDEEERNWPKSRKVREALWPTDGSAQISIVGRPDQMVREKIIPDPVEPAEWSILEPSTLGTREYLSGIDFYLGYTRDQEDESTEAYVVEAMSLGTVCVLPPHLQTQFGDAAVYAEPKNVQSAIAGLWNAVDYVAQQQRAFDFVSSRRTVDDYASRLGRVPSHPVG